MLRFFGFYWVIVRVHGSIFVYYLWDYKWDNIEIS